jgi:GNAT superfamily N-acetyltransferase
MTNGKAVQIQIAPYHPGDLASLVELWNQAFVDRRNFRPLSAAEFQRRVLDCAVFEPDRLLLAWAEESSGRTKLVGLAYAFRPAPQTPLYRTWRRHTIALLYVLPEFRQGGVGSSLLRAAETWLYYCPIDFAGPVQPCDGTLEGPQPPFFGSTQRLAAGTHDRALIHFLTRRGYEVVDPGDASLRLDQLPAGAPAPELDLATLELRRQTADEQRPFTGQVPEGRVRDWSIA